MKRDWGLRDVDCGLEGRPSVTGNLPTSRLVDPRRLVAGTSDVARRLFRWVGIGLVLAGMAGCAPVKREELAKEVLASDPDFAAVLEKHREITSRIETYERELALKRSTIEHQITQLRKEFSEAAGQVRKRTAHAKQQMEPDLQRLELAISMASEELRAKRIQRSSLGRSIAQLRKASKTQQDVWSPEERKQHEAQLEELRRDAQRLDQELASLTAHVRLLRMKLLLIKL